MHPQLAAIVDDYESASARLRALAEHTLESRWLERSDPARWSVAECIAHLNLTSVAYLPLIDRAVVEARALREAGARAPRRYRRDLAGWFLWRTVGPPVRMRVKTTAAFVPAAGAPRGDVMAEFERLQRDQLERVRAADGLALGRVRICSPFNARFAYNLYACLTMLPRHQHRHLWQAEHVWPPSSA